MSHTPLSLPTPEVTKRAEAVAKQQFQRFLSNWTQQLFWLQAQEKTARINLKKAA